MKTILRLDEIDETSRAIVGGKAVALAAVARAGFIVPEAVCVGAPVYDRFVEATGLRARIVMEHGRKPFDQMRWEEIWDTALRIQNLFINTELPGDIAALLREHLGSAFAFTPVVVRSSALGEDSRKASFAGLHESFVNVRGVTAILKHIKLVWASLWSDRAMLYRAEIGLDVSTSRMAVVVQELIEGQKSGVVFGVSPTDESQAVIESVYGLNQGLVDGTIAPDRWIVDRADGAIRSHTAATREKRVVARSTGVAVVPLPKQQQARAPLTNREVKDVYRSSRRLENTFGFAQDVEWTYRDAQLCLLQSRPITTTTGISRDDNRAWYLSLHRSLENLTTLRERIEKTYIPQMISVSGGLAGQDLTILNKDELVAAIRDRQGTWTYWQQVYWDHFIPFAHAVRLFGQIYNRVMTPEDPHEFARLLPSAPLKSVERNRRLIKMAGGVRGRQGRAAISRFARDADSATLCCLLTTTAVDKQVAFLRELAKVSGRTNRPGRASGRVLAERFLAAFPAAERTKAGRLLELARVSYKLRDDDNIYLGRVEAELLRALAEAKRRSGKAAGLRVTTANADQFVQALVDLHFRAARTAPPSQDKTSPALRARQLVGQPAGEGVAVGAARVVRRREELLDFKRDEILVCDAVDPNMTFVVPLAAGIIERRGGMLIHGAIIAREYGLPCVTGVPGACDALRTGDRITVDGYLGIVTVGSAPDAPEETSLAKQKSAAKRRRR